MPGKPKYNSMYERLVAQTLEPENAQSCWLVASAVATERYGRVNQRGADGKVVCKDAHRLMLEQLIGRPLLPDEHGDHLCFRKPCINPDHLETVHYKTNLARRRTYGFAHTPQPIAPHGVDPLQVFADRAWDTRGKVGKRVPF